MHEIDWTWTNEVTECGSMGWTRTHQFQPPYFPCTWLGESKSKTLMTLCDLCVQVMTFVHIVQLMVLETCHRHEAKSEQINYCRFLWKPYFEKMDVKETLKSIDNNKWKHFDISWYGFVNKFDSTHASWGPARVTARYCKYWAQA